MRITYYGHSCFLVEINGKKLLFDPFISQNPLASNIDAGKIKADFILVSHGHADHTADLLSLANQTGATVVSNWEICSWVQSKGYKKVHPMNIGGHWIFEFGKVKCVNAVHSSSLPDGTYGGNPMGFLIETPDGKFYYAGDTALHLDMKLIGDYKKMDLAFLPIGNNFTMGIDNAVIASDFIRCDRIIGMHYDTFDMIKIDHDEAKKKFDSAGKQLTLMQVGQTLEH
ncbi:MAG: metal-dependent hydrolase [Bacteroidota bacterium]|jgi:L-ascorbate metabolism protein UlaG (beta-lactamase superfamily)|nr:metal-dependent hydrolase [Bacteroidia bacterium]MBP6010050.1 metal-dependent hydrolase [Bacteroidia bacterium]MBP7270946.1 metal-dependent hydrolase [Bacteroidia bacterium]MBP7436995.1 metal-dependent hydrolase [Bacteroidia bacterium]MBP7772029.1 metal-dependent hydrolase [Bacteroidia bacterium]